MSEQDQPQISTAVHPSLVKILAVGVGTAALTAVAGHVAEINDSITLFAQAHLPAFVAPIIPWVTALIAYLLKSPVQKVVDKNY